MIRLCRTALLVLLLSNMALSQPALRFHRYTIDNGLSHGGITDMVIDKKGYIWLATEDGLNRFNGYEFEVFRHNPNDSLSLSTNYLHDMFVDSSNRLWLTGAANIYDGSGFRPFQLRNPAYSLPPLSFRMPFQDSRQNIWFTASDSSHQIGLARLFPNQADTLYIHCNQSPKSLHHHRIDCFFEDGAFLWLGTHDGLCRFDYENNSFHTFKIDSMLSQHPQEANKVYQLLLHQPDHVLVGTYDGLYLFDKKTERFFRPAEFYPMIPSFENQLVHQIFKDRFGDVWVSAFDKQLLHFTNSRSFLYSSKGRGNLYLPSNCIRRVYEDSHGELWLNSRRGLSWFDRASHSFHTYKHHKNNLASLSSNSIEKVLDDGKGSLWIATLGNGLNQMNRFVNAFKVIQNRHGHQKLPSNTIRAIFRDHHGRLLLSATNGVDVFDERTQTSQPFFNKVLNADSLTITAIHHDKNGVFWFGTWAHGLVRWDERKNETTFYTPPDSLPPHKTWAYVRHIVDDDSGTLWLATKNGGLFQFNKMTNTIKQIFPPEYESGNRAWIVLSLYLDKADVLWIGGDDNGLWRYNTVSQEFTNFRHSADNPTSISNNTIFDIFQDSRDRFWISTFHGGLNRFDPSTKEFSAIRITDGLASDAVYGTHEDLTGFLWVNTNGGLCRLDPETGAIKTFSMADGLPANGPMLSSWQDRDCFYFGTRNGLVYFNPLDIKTNPHIPPVYLTGFSKSDEKMYNEAELEKMDDITLSYKDFVFSFEFVALNYINPHANQYAYKLAGLHDDWISTNGQRRATFSRVPPGRYTFRVKASNNDGVWNETGAAMNIKITPPFWQTWWFRSSAMLIIFGIMSLFYRQRLQHHRRIERMRIKIADDLHDEIGSNLGSISMLSDMILDNKTDAQKSRDFLTTIHDTAMKTAESMRDIVWFIHQENNSAERVLLRMRSFVKRVLPDDSFTFIVEDKAFTDKLDLNAKHNFYLILKEILNNINRHAQATQVDISIRTADGQTILSVADNGVGFDTHAESAGIGLTSMRRRAQNIGATLHIFSEQGQGTRTEVRL